MNQVEYTLLIQKISLIATSVSFFGFCTLLVFLDPYDNPLYVWGFIALLFVFIMGIITLLVFWWFFGVRKQILEISQVNSIIYQSSITAIVVITIMVLNQTQELNGVTAGVVGAIYTVYWLWLTSREIQE